VKAPGRIYVVEPTGEFEDDPNLTDKKFPGNPTQSFRSREPLRVVRELVDWVGHAPEKLSGMRAGVQRIGTGQIESVKPSKPPTPADSALYYGENYPAMFAGIMTEFDFSGSLVSGGTLKEKMLFEYNYAKSSDQRKLDGNAHERLGFQILQYIEIAKRYPSCSFNVIAAQAFSEYRNKYHPAFNQQALRLNEIFQAVQFRFAACRS
jgi:hypothetical protein